MFMDCYSAGFWRCFNQILCCSNYSIACSVYNVHTIKLLLLTVLLPWHAHIQYITKKCRAKKALLNSSGRSVHCRFDLFCCLLSDWAKHCILLVVPMRRILVPLTTQRKMLQNKCQIISAVMPNVLRVPQHDQYLFWGEVNGASKTCKTKL